MLSKKISIGQTKLGKAWIANEDISIGETIWEAKGEIPGIATGHLVYKTLDEVTAMPDKDLFTNYAYCVKLNPVTFLGPDLKVGIEKLDKLGLMKEFYQNHSCDPNTWYCGPNKMIARRSIAKGEEVTYDYATSEVCEMEFDCECGAECCRKKITGDDWKSLQDKYKDHFIHS